MPGYIQKQTFATPTIWDPDTEGNTAKKLAGPCEVSNLKLAANASAAFVLVYDAAGASGALAKNLKWVLDASTTDVDQQSFANPITFRRGLYCDLQQGAGFRPFICAAVVGPTNA